MLIQTFSRDQLTSAYNILCQRLYSQSAMPFGSTWCVIEPGGSTAPHHHHEGETFYILSGQGLMRIRDESSPLRQGDVVLIPPFSNHVLKNTSDTESLTFVSVYWEEPDRVWESPPPKRVLLFSAPPTPNGDMHLGHLSGPYVAVDVFRRFLRLTGVEVTYLCGSDDNQSYVPTKGMALKLSPQAVIDRFATSIRSTLQRYDAVPDAFLSPHGNGEYIEFVTRFFNRLKDTGKVELRKTETPYCETCQLYLYEAHVHGGCPVCGATTNGNGCEDCGSTNDCSNLKAPVCNHCSTPAVLRTVEKYYFPLGHYSDRLKQHLETMAIPARMREFGFKLIDRGLPDVTVSHLAQWGIPVPSTPGQTFYAWFEMAAGYLYMAPHWTDPEAQVYGFFGFDNSFFYLTFIPALLMAYDDAGHLPAGHMINQFYTLDGKKFSTSRNHAVWGDDIVAHVPSDVIRLYLAYSRSELAQTDFTLRDFADFVRQELVLEWEPFLARFDEVRDPEAALPSELTGACRHFAAVLEQARIDMTQCYAPTTFSLNEAARVLCTLVRRSRRFLEAQWPLRHLPGSEWRTSVALLEKAVYRLGVMAWPIMPNFGAHVLGQAPTSWSASGRPAPVLADARFSAALKGLLAFAGL